MANQGNQHGPDGSHTDTNQQRSADSNGNELKARGIEMDVATVVTQVVVDENDPAFKKPTKPIGGLYDKETAEKIAAEKGFTMVEDAGRGYRRVVASPKPVDVVEKNVVSTLMKGGHVVITVGGGGIPVISKDGRLIGTPAVIDKDFASAKLAELICADMLVILTAVDRVAINWGKPTRSLWKRCPWPRPSSTAVRVISHPAACCPRWRLPCPLPASAVLPSSPAWKTQQQRCVARAAPAYTHKDQQNIPAFGQVRKIYFYRIFRQRNFGCAVFPYASYSFQNGNDVVNIM